MLQPLIRLPESRATVLTLLLNPPAMTPMPICPPLMVLSSASALPSSVSIPYSMLLNILTNNRSDGSEFPACSNDPENNVMSSGQIGLGGTTGRFSHRCRSGVQVL